MTYLCNNLDPLISDNTDAKKHKWINNWWYNASKNCHICNNICNLDNITDECKKCVIDNKDSCNTIQNCLNNVNNQLSHTDEYNALKNQTSKQVNNIYLAFLYIIVFITILIICIIISVIIKKNILLIFVYGFIFYILLCLIIIQYLNMTKPPGYNSDFSYVYY
jgi:hypothetical protein